MKRILMSLMVIAVAVALVGTATVAHYSDTEESFNNYMITGSLDLVVNGQHDQPWGQGVPMKVHLDSMQPDKSYDFPFEMTSASQDCYGNAFIHLKNIQHSDVVPHNTHYTIPDPVTGSPKPEPEIVAEYGGWLGQVWVNGLGGAYGEDCNLSRHIEVIAISWYIENQAGDPPAHYPGSGTVNLARFDTDPANGVVKLNELECHNIFLGVIPPEDDGGKYTLYGDLHFMLQDIDEDDPALWHSLGIPYGTLSSSASITTTTARSMRTVATASITMAMA